jgi:hypothetical protein
VGWGMMALPDMVDETKHKKKKMNENDRFDESSYCSYGRAITSMKSVC